MPLFVSLALQKAFSLRSPPRCLGKACACSGEVGIDPWRIVCLNPRPKTYRCRGCDDRPVGRSTGLAGVQEQLYRSCSVLPAWAMTAGPSSRNPISSCVKLAPPWPRESTTSPIRKSRRPKLYSRNIHSCISAILPKSARRSESICWLKRPPLTTTNKSRRVKTAHRLIVPCWAIDNEFQRRSQQSRKYPPAAERTPTYGNSGSSPSAKANRQNINRRCRSVVAGRDTTVGGAAMAPSQPSIAGLRMPGAPSGLSRCRPTLPTAQTLLPIQRPIPTKPIRGKVDASTKSTNYSRVDRAPAQVRSPTEATTRNQNIARTQSDALLLESRRCLHKAICTMRKSKSNKPKDWG